MAIDAEGVDFWGVQYHPEFAFHTMAVIFRRLTKLLLREGLFDSEEKVEIAAARYEQANEDGQGTELVEQLGLTDAVRDDALRSLEIANWLRTKVVL